MKKSVSLGLLSLVLVLGGFVSSPAAKSDCPEKDKETIAINFANEMIAGAYKAVGTAELKKWVDEKKPMLIIDTMPFEDSYKKEHVPGAVCLEFPIPEMTSMDDKKKAEFIKLLGPDKDKLLVFYCGFTECTRSHNGAMWAVKLGYKNVYRCPGGIAGWAAAGFPVGKVE